MKRFRRLALFIAMHVPLGRFGARLMAFGLGASSYAEQPAEDSPCRCSVERVGDQFRWHAVIDEFTCDACRALDGRVFREGEIPFPPLHLKLDP